MKISIVTPVLNRAGMIARAIDSVLSQGYPDFEHIIIDGGSTDGTLEVVARYPHLVVISEPDQGIYDGLNKGIARAGGDIIGHLNSDDVYLPGTFAAVAQAFAGTPGTDSVCGEGVILENGREVFASDHQPGCLTLGYHNALLGVPMINARFFTRAFYQRTGSCTLALRYAADRDFLVRAVLQGCRTVYLPQRVYAYDMHDGSATITRNGQSVEKFVEDNRKLATLWLQQPALPDDLRLAATHLLGRSLVRLGVLRLRRGDIGGLLQLSFRWQGRLSPVPLAAMTRATAGWLWQRRR